MDRFWHKKALRGRDSQAAPLFVRDLAVEIPFRSPGRLIKGLGFGSGREVGAVSVGAFRVIRSSITRIRLLFGSILAPLVLVESFIRHVPRTLPDPELLLPRESPAELVNYPTRASRYGCRLPPRR